MTLSLEKDFKGEKSWLWSFSVFITSGSRWSQQHWVTGSRVKVQDSGSVKQALASDSALTPSINHHSTPQFLPPQMGHDSPSYEVARTPLCLASILTDVSCSQNYLSDTKPSVHSLRLEIPSFQKPIRPTQGSYQGQLIASPLPSCTLKHTVSWPLLSLPTLWIRKCDLGQHAEVVVLITCNSSGGSVYGHPKRRSVSYLFSWWWGRAGTRLRGEVAKTGRGDTKFSVSWGLSHW